ncbi:MAG: zinc-ribbon domain-containing protein [Ruminococcaceae bacterium]|nr:zinc-ribbon domain-containing protein [Oscillospiraceae bacterium]
MFCSKCGKEIMDEAVICPHCGCSPKGQNAKAITNSSNSGMKTVAKVLMILSTVILGFWIIPLAWCLPLTIMYCNKVSRGEPISTGFKVCCLLFVNLIAGILMLCDND